MRFALALTLLLVAAVASAAGGRAYRNDALKVRFEAPVGWDALGAGNYPRLLQSYENRDGGRMTLVGQKVAVGTTARALVEESRAALVRQGFRNVVVSADKEVQHGKVVHVIDLAKLEGITKFAINVELTN